MILCMIGGMEIIVISAVVILFFGGKKLPELMKGMDRGMKSFKQGLTELDEEDSDKHTER